MNNNHVVKCRLCDNFYLIEGQSAYCVFRSIRISANKEKTRCTDYVVTDLRWRCANYPDGCPDGCDAQVNHPERCPKYEAR